MATRETLEFDPNVTHRIALQYRTGRIVEGRNGQRVMFALVDGRVMFHDLDIADKIYALNLGPGEPFEIANIKNGRVTDWKIERIFEPPIGEQPDGTFAVPKATAPRETAAAGVRAPATTAAAPSKPQPDYNSNASRPYNAAGIPTPPTKIPMNVAVREAVQMVRDAMLATGEQWSDASRQGLVSTILIGGQREGWISMWERPAAREASRAA